VLSLDIRSLRQRTGAPERQLATYTVILCVRPRRSRARAALG